MGCGDTGCWWRMIRMGIRCSLIIRVGARAAGIVGAETRDGWCLTLPLIEKLRLGKVQMEEMCGRWLRLEGGGGNGG